MAGVGGRDSEWRDSEHEMVIDSVPRSPCSDFSDFAAFTDFSESTRHPFTTLRGCPVAMPIRLSMAIVIERRVASGVR